MQSYLLSAWHYRQFIWSSVKNELTSQFTRSRFGGIWIILNPLIQVAIYALILSAVLSNKISGIDNRFSYAIYLTSGMLAWSLFSDVINRCLTLFIDNANLMKKMSFPKLTMPLIVIGTALINNLFLLLSIVLVFLLLGHYPSLNILYLPILLLILIMFSLGVGLILGVLNVFIRDIGQIVPIILQLGFWFTPIVYPISIIPEEVRAWLVINPLYTIVSNYQSILVFSEPPEFISVIFMLIIAAGALILSFKLFRKASPEMVDVL